MKTQEEKLKIKEIIKNAKKSVGLKGNIKPMKIKMYDDDLIEANISFKTKLDLECFMFHVQDLATRTNFGYRYGQNMAGAEIENDDYLIDFGVPKGENGDNNHWHYQKTYIEISISCLNESKIDINP
ncbi:MAG TPA: hypothetical protein PLL09_04590 [Flavobacterium sp.]|uniref:hypothetical protein n=1 Tax=unclassified Flavobacterium TaxID=196869 RepID=UPI0025C094FC|nr:MULTISPECIES: hypothetical protein [unclassified Flavobacterium]HRE77086.1 hypothetical protein [Flavobacterium sp.]